MKNTACADPFRRRRNHAAFTLIEMLVVIAIIAILISLIVPSLARSRASAEDSVCVNNLKQVGTAILAYAGDHGGVLPPTGFYGVSSHYNRDPRNFQNSLRSYLQLPEATTWSTNPDLTSYSKVFHCPSYKGPKGGKGYALHNPVIRPDGTSLRPWGFMTNASGSLNPKPMALDEMPPNDFALRDNDFSASKPSHRKHRNALYFDFSIRPLNHQNEPL